MNYFIKLTVFCTTLISAYSFWLGISWLPILSVLVLLAFIACLFFAGKPINTTLSEPGILFGSYCYFGLFVLSLLLSPLSLTTDWLQIIGFAVSFLVLFELNVVFKYVDPVKLVSFVVIIHVIFLFLHWIGIGVFNYNIDFVSYLSEKGSKNSLGHFKFLGRLVLRPSGLFNEPGTFSTYMAPMLFSLFPHRHIKRVKHVIRLMLLCFIVTLSTYGLLMAALYFAVLGLSKLKTISFLIRFSPRKIISIFGILLIFAVPLMLSMQYFLKRFVGTAVSTASDTGLMYRFNWFSENASYFISNYSFWPYLGPGYFEDASVAFDLSLIVHSLFFYGAIPLLLFLMGALALYLHLNRLYMFAPSVKYGFWGLSLAILLLKFNVYNVAATSVLALSYSSLFHRQSFRRLLKKPAACERMSHRH